MEYPFEEGFRAGEWEGIIRVKVAAVCACIDNERCGGDSSSALEEEIDPYFKVLEELAPDGAIRTSQINPHAFLYLPPEGNLANDVEDVLNALIASISAGELPTASLRISLDGTINPVETWIYPSDFRKWCVQRQIQLDNVFEDYMSGEWEIFSHSYENARDMRKASEAPLFDETFLKIHRPDFDSHEGLLKRYEELFLEHFLGTQDYAKLTAPAVPNSEKPVTTTERNTLLLIIAALAERAGIDHSHRSAASAIAATIEILGAKVSAETIREKFDMIPDAIARREVVLAKRAKQK